MEKTAPKAVFFFQNYFLLIYSSVGVRDGIILGLFTVRICLHRIRDCRFDLHVLGVPLLAGSGNRISVIRIVHCSFPMSALSVLFPTGMLMLHIPVKTIHLNDSHIHSPLSPSLSISLFLFLSHLSSFPPLSINIPFIYQSSRNTCGV